MLTYDLLQELNHRFSTYAHNVFVESGVLTKEEWDEVKKLFEDVDKAYAEIVVSDTVKNPTEEQIASAKYALKDYVRDDEFTETFSPNKGVNLPSEVEIPVNDLDDDLDVDEAISNWLSNMYGYCVLDFQYDYMNSDCMDYYVHDIHWDEEE